MLLYFAGSKRSRVSESTTATILSTSDINEDDRDSDSGGELRVDHSLGIAKITNTHTHFFENYMFYLILFFNQK